MNIINAAIIVGNQPNNKPDIDLSNEACGRRETKISIIYSVINKGNIEAHLADLQDIEALTERQCVDSQDCNTVRSRGGLPKIETVRDLQLKLHLANAEIIAARDLKGNLRGFCLTIWGDFCVPKDDHEWANWIDHRYTKNVAERAVLVTAAKLGLEKGDEIIDLIVVDTQRCGIGTGLLQEALKRSSKRGSTYVFAAIDQRNEVSRFFIKNGFVPKADNPSNYSDFLSSDGTVTGVQREIYFINPEDYVMTSSIRRSLREDHQNGLTSELGLLARPISKESYEHAIRLAESCFPLDADETKMTFNNILAGQPKQWVKVLNEKGEETLVASEYIQHWVLYKRIDSLEIPVALSGLYRMDGDPKTTMYLGWFGVSPDFQRQGIATDVLDFTKRVAKELGATRLRVLTGDIDPNYVAARCFYEKAGFELEGKFYYLDLDDPYDAPYCERVMGLSLL